MRPRPAKTVWAEPQRFLAGFRTGGTIKARLANVKVCRRTLELWKQHDLLRFRDRFLAAHQEFCDSQEQILYGLNEGPKPGQVPTGLLATLNANRPHKWGPDIRVTHEVLNELIQQLRKLQELSKEPEQSQATDSAGDQVIDWEGRVLPWD